MLFDSYVYSLAGGWETYVLIATLIIHGTLHITSARPAYGLTKYGLVGVNGRPVLIELSKGSELQLAFCFPSGGQFDIERRRNERIFVGDLGVDVIARMYLHANDKFFRTIRTGLYASAHHHRIPLVGSDRHIRFSCRLWLFADGSSRCVEHTVVIAFHLGILSIFLHSAGVAKRHSV